MATTLTINIGGVRDISPDPLSFMQGFIHGYADRRGGRGGKEYQRGQKLGQQVKNGEVEMPTWAHPATRGSDAS